MIEIEYSLWDMERSCVMGGDYHIYVPEGTTVEEALAMMAEDGALPIKISNLHLLKESEK